MNVSVKPGDTMSGIAQQRGVALQDMIRANPQVSNPNLIHAGQQLQVPGGGGLPPSARAGPPAAGPGELPSSRDEFQPAPRNGAAPVNLDGNGSPDKALETARGLIGRGYGDIDSGTPVGRDSPVMNCAQFVNAVYPDLPSGAPALTAMSTPGAQPTPGDVLCSNSPGPYGHVGIMTDAGTVIHSIPGRGVHESSLAEFTASSPIDGVIPR